MRAWWAAAPLAWAALLFHPAAPIRVGLAAAIVLWARAPSRTLSPGTSTTGR